MLPTATTKERRSRKLILALVAVCFVVMIIGATMLLVRMASMGDHNPMASHAQAESIAGARTHADHPSHNSAGAAVHQDVHTAAHAAAVMAMPNVPREALRETVTSSGAKLGTSAPKSPEPTYEWQPYQDGSNFAAGLEFRLRLDGSGKQDVRIPPTWRLQLNLGGKYHLFRTDIERSTKIGALRAQVAEFAGVDVGRVQLSRPIGHRHISPALARHFKNLRKRLLALKDEETAESASLFHYQHDLVVILDE